VTEYLVPAAPVEQAATQHNLEFIGGGLAPRSTPKRGYAGVEVESGTRRALDMVCPKCNLSYPETVTRCGCGDDLRAGKVVHDDSGIREIVSVMALFFTFYLAHFLPWYWLPFWKIVPAEFWILNLGSLLCAILVTGYTWRHTASQGLAISIGVGAIVTGAIAFLAGFMGPMIRHPMSPDGPLLGIFFTGPLGILAGAVGGAIYWSVRRKLTKVKSI
jgi:hypothetical protein